MTTPIKVPPEHALSRHAGHAFDVDSDYGVLALKCSTCCDAEWFLSARPASEAGEFLGRHLRCRRVECDGAQVRCADHDEVIAEAERQGPAPGTA